MTNRVGGEIVVVGASVRELAPLVRRLTGRRSASTAGLRSWNGLCQGYRLRLVATGEGRRAAAAAMTSICAANEEVDGVVILGVSGSLSRELEADALVLGVEAVTEGGAQPVALSNFQGLPSFQRCRLLTVDRIIGSSHERQALAGAFEAGLPLAVDMESHDYASAARAVGYRVLALRGISDSFSDVLPTWLADYRDVEGRLQQGRIAWRAVRRPADAVRLARLGRRVGRLSRRLASEFENLLRSADGRSIFDLE